MELASGIDSRIGVSDCLKLNVMVLVGGDEYGGKID